MSQSNPDFRLIHDNMTSTKKDGILRAFGEKGEDYEDYKCKHVIYFSIYFRIASENMNNIS